MYANPSGKVPIGILLNDMVDVDITRHKVNPYKNEVQKGGKVTILRKGWVITDMIHSTGTPGAGSGLYLADSGLFSTSTRALALNSGATPIGKFLSAKDSNGTKITRRAPVNCWLITTANNMETPTFFTIRIIPLFTTERLTKAILQEMTSLNMKRMKKQANILL